jgi:ATP-dependent Clp protease ATP-binding subunit ClpX
VSKRTQLDSSLACSFCHKHQDVVGKLISSPSDYPRAYICDECIAVCNSILEDDKTYNKPETGSVGPSPEIRVIREELRLLLDDIADGDIPTVAKILHALA